MNLFDKHGGYRKLDSFTLATVIQLGTWRFCEKFLNRTNDPCGRQFDQMTQAARSGRAVTRRCLRWQAVLRASEGSMRKRLNGSRMRWVPIRRTMWR